MTKDARAVFVNNLKRVMNDKHKRPSQIARDLNLPLSTVAGWANGSSYPRVDSMQRLADYLNVSMRTLTDEQQSSSLNEDIQFSTVEEAMEYIIKMPVVSAYGGYDLDRMSDEEVIQLANKLTGVFKMLAEEHKK